MANSRKSTHIEFILMMASLMSLSSLSLDALLPALPEIGDAIRVADPHKNQWLITMMFLGLGTGQLLSGPLSDSFGRKKVLYFGIIVFTIASLVCVYATSLEMMLTGRIMQGFGLSAPRTVSMAMTRDKFSGDRMARIISFVTAIFILVPVIAPTFGQLILNWLGWESIFHSQLIFGILVTIWLWQRQPETLKQEYKLKFERSIFRNGLKEFFKYRQAVIFTISIGLILGAFLAYLSACQQIYQVQYGLVEEFPLIFAGIAIGIGIATFLNGRIVMRFGMLKIATTSFIIFTSLSLLYVILFYGKPNPDIWVLLGFFLVILCCVGFIFGNQNALALQPLGHIAGIGSALVGFFSTLMGVPIANLIGRFVDVTVLPIFIGFSICGMLSLSLIAYFKYHENK